MEKMFIVNQAKTTETTFSVLADKRTKIIFTEEGILREHDMTVEQYLRILNSRYRDVFDVEIPYHYFISRSGGVFWIKPDHLKSPIRALGNYTNDIFVLLEGSAQNIRPAQRPIAAELVERMYQKYGITPLNTLFFPYDLRRHYIRSASQRNVVDLAIDLIESTSDTFVAEMSMAKAPGRPKVSFSKAPKNLRMIELAELAGVKKSVVMDLADTLPETSSAEQAKAGRVVALPAEPRNTSPKLAEDLLKESASIHEINQRTFM